MVPRVHNDLLKWTKRQCPSNSLGTTSGPKSAKHPVVLADDGVLGSIQLVNLTPSAGIDQVAVRVTHGSGIHALTAERLERTVLELARHWETPLGQEVSRRLPLFTRRLVESCSRELLSNSLKSHANRAFAREVHKNLCTSSPE